MTVLAAVENAPAVQQHRTGYDLLQAALDAGASAWIGPTDMVAERLITLWDDMQAARDLWHGQPTDTNFKAYIGLSKEVTACLSALGLDPTARGRLGLAQVKARSRLEELRDRKTRLLAGRPAG